jgi:hypothetical protein
MIGERFQELAATYGAGLQRWPAEERQAAIDFARAYPAEARAVLARASALDRMLDRYAVVAPEVDLREGIIALAPTGAVPRSARLWWQGAGLAGLGVVSALAGALVINVLLPLGAPAPDDDGVYVITAFDDVSDELGK